MLDPEFFSDPELRRELAGALHVDNALRETLGESVVRAHGLIPPGLLAADPRAPEERAVSSSSGYVQSDPRGRLRAAVLASAFRGPYAPLWDWIERVFQLRGWAVDAQFGEAGRSDRAVSSWVRSIW